jgi:hypothetical protein
MSHRRLKRPVHWTGTCGANPSIPGRQRFIRAFDDEAALHPGGLVTSDLVEKTREAALRFRGWSATGEKSGEKYFGRNTRPGAIWGGWQSVADSQGGARLEDNSEPLRLG